ncbi:MAG: hypothetical protein MZV64_20310 [Ignavibacteriales bacterium]|nr:hypothetical protein [Ignavibacteriales bacterium]
MEAHKKNETRFASAWINSMRRLSSKNFGLLELPSRKISLMKEELSNKTT